MLNYLMSMWLEKEKELGMNRSRERLVFW
jgi:hypothetical protein